MSDREPDGYGQYPLFDYGDDRLPENLLRRYASVIRRRYRWILLGLVLGLVAGVVVAKFTKPPATPTNYFKATNTFVVNASTGDASGSGTTAPVVLSLRQLALLIQSSTLAQQVATETGQPVNVVNNQLSAYADENVGAIDVTGIATDPNVAVQLANSGAKFLQLMAQTTQDAQGKAALAAAQKSIDALTQRASSLEAQIATNPPEVAQLKAQLDNTRASLSTATSQLAQVQSQSGPLQISTLQPAHAQQINGQGYSWRMDQNINARSPIASVQSGPSPDFNELNLSNPVHISDAARIAIGGAAGLILGIISAFLFEAWDDRIRRRESVEELTGLPVLAEIPHFKREQSKSHVLALIDNPTGPASERYRATRTAMHFAMEDLGVEGNGGPLGSRTPVVLITSPGPGEGKTTTVANLAAAFAESETRTLVIDGDFRRPSLRRHLNPVPNLVSPDQPCETRVDGVHFLAGPTAAATPDKAIIALRHAVNRWRDDYDLVILDTPPILTTNDATDLLEVADVLLLVLRSGQTRSRPANRVVSLLARFRVDVLGVVLNSCDRAEMEPYYDYGYGYHGYHTRRVRTGAEGSEVPPGSLNGQRVSPSTGHNGSDAPPNLFNGSKRTLDPDSGERGDVETPAG